MNSKSLKIMSQISLAPLLACALFLGGCATTVKVHPDFAKRHEHMQRIAVMPPDVEAYEITFNAGPKPLADLKELVESKSLQNINTAFKQKGYEVTNVAITSDKLEKDPQLKEAWFDIQTLYKQALKDIQANKKTSFTYEIGSGPNYFADKEKVNAIILTRQSGTKLSQGMIGAQLAQNIASIATSLLVGVSAGGGGQPWWTLDTQIAVVDAESGDILWYNLDRTIDDYTKPKDEKVIHDHINKILGLFPDSKFKKKETDTSKTPANTKTTPMATKANFASPKAMPTP